MHFLVKVSKINTSRMIVLPKILAEYAGFNQGDTLMLTMDKDKTVRILTNDQLNKVLADHKKAREEEGTHEAR